MKEAAEDIRKSLNDSGYGHLEVRVVEFVKDFVRKAGGDAAPSPASGQEPSYLEAPLSIPGLFRIVLSSAALRPNIDAYATNIDGFGHRIKPRFGDDEVKAAIEAEMARAKAGTAGVEAGSTVESRLEKWREEAAEEKAMVERFFEHATVGASFVSLRRRTRFDREACGNGFWEVARGTDGGLLSGKIYHAPAKYMRLYPALDEMVVEQREQIDALTWRDAPVRRRFRKFACVAGDGLIERHLKEFGDKRALSSRTGAFYASVVELRDKEGPGAEEANEVVHFPIYSGDLGYGQPRWVGALLDVLGAISVGEVNYLFFEEGGGVPEIAVLVSGARLGDGSAEAVEDKLKEHRERGPKGMRRALVLEARPADNAIGSGIQPKVDVKPLRGDLSGDFTFGAYDEKATEKIGSQFRLPPILRGVIRDINRATATAAIEYSEAQVFAGEREDFDWFMNNVFLAEAGVKWHNFVSLGPQVHDLEGVSAAMSNLRWCVTPKEARRYVTDNTTLDLEELDPEREEWSLRPLEITLAGRGYDVTPAGEKRGSAPWLKGRHLRTPHEVIADEEDESGSGKPE